MKSASKSITFTPSDTITQRLEEFARIAGVTSEEMVNDILAVQFGPDYYMETLRNYIYDRGNGRGRYPKARANKLANSYNAFAKAEAERTGRLLTNEARVESGRGSSHLYFPVIKSPEVRRAMKAASWSFRPFRF
ncbi:MAG TPA: hypothetical protein VFO40_27230 [Chthoniobacterales bacterium]|nr:hypothetical protein [Chthoniobacterales bacterium]